MRIESVTAHAFGPFLNETLELGPGMTIIYGPNESGKSSWHAALYAALCGMRRGRGRTMKEDEAFEARHRPWNGDAWKVSAIIGLEDGRKKVELRHELDGKTGSAHDVNLGRDYSSDIINEGAPDGAVWLGLDRRSFLSTACVRQADIQAVVNDADTLHAHMQRAASTAGADETAASALEGITEFYRGNVGQDRSNSTRPLRVARERLETAQDSLQSAQEAHNAYVAQLGTLEALESDATQAERKRRIVEAAVARATSTEARQTLERARELNVKHRHDPAPEHAQQDKMAQKTKYALHSWNNRPEPVTLTGLSAEELQYQLGGLPPMPEGDTEPHPAVVEAKENWNLARRGLDAHAANEPPEPGTVNAGGLTQEEIHNLIAGLSLQEPQVGPGLQERVDEAQAKVDSFEEKDARKPSGPFAWLLRLIAAILSIFQGKQEADATARLKAAKQLATAKEELGEVRFQVNDTRQRKTAAANKATAHGLPSDSEKLNTLDKRLAGASQAERDLDKWRSQETILREKADQAERALADALRTRGVTSPQSVADTLAAYEAVCKQRGEQYREASRRPDLAKALKAREGEEGAAAAAERRRAEAIDDLRQASEALGIQEGDDETLAARLRAWVKNDGDAAPDRERAAEEWRELRNLLQEGGIEDLESVTAKAREAAETSAQGLGESAINLAVLEPDTEAQLRSLRDIESERKRSLNTAVGEIRETARNLPSVAEAEEEVERAQTERERVTNLGNILSKTQEFLERAQEEVHRDIAPHLVNALAPWIKDVTGGRYSSVTVDPQDLMVRVSGHGGNMRDAPLLSHGTTEQIYLLLRVAMAGLLTRASGESCPLLLDDVTVHCDPTRQSAILNLLHAISRERQIILFSQEPETLTWAQQCLQETVDRLVELDPSGIPA